MMQGYVDIKTYMIYVMSLLLNNINGALKF
jgi:hypothetical protein